MGNNLDVPISYKTEWKIASGEGFREFLEGLREYLKTKLILINSDTASEHYSCGCDALIATRPRNWRRFRYLQEYCEQEGLEWMTAWDILEQNLRRKIKCDCSIINDVGELKANRLRGFGVDVESVKL